MSVEVKENNVTKRLFSDRDSTSTDDRIDPKVVAGVSSGAAVLLIILILICLFDVAKTKWKNLRDNFRTEWKKQRKGKSGDAGTSPADEESKWVWFKSLLFLKHQMASRQMSSNLPNPTARPSSAQNEDSQEEANKDDVDNETEGNTDTEDQSLLTDDTPSVSKNYTNYNKRKRNATDTELINIEKKKIQLIQSHLIQSRNTEKSKPEDDLYHFLMSLHKPLSDLPIDRQMFVRIKMQELLYNEIIYCKEYQQNLSNSLSGRNFTSDNRQQTDNIQYVGPPSVSPMYSNASSSNDDLWYKRL